MIYVVKVLKVIVFLALCIVSQKILNGLQFLVQGILLIAFWGNWILDDESAFSKKYGKIFNYMGIMAIVAGIGHLLK